MENQRLKLVCIAQNVASVSKNLHKKNKTKCCSATGSLTGVDQDRDSDGSLPASLDSGKSHTVGLCNVTFRLLD